MIISLTFIPNIHILQYNNDQIKRTEINAKFLYNNLPEKAVFLMGKYDIERIKERFTFKNIQGTLYQISLE